MSACLVLSGAIKTAQAQGADCREFTSAQQVSANAGASPHVCAYNETVNLAANTNIRHVLLYDWTAGHHNRGPTQRHMLRLSRDYGFRLDRSQDSTYITPTTLQGVNVMVINNSDGDAFENSTSLQAMRNFVEVRGGAMFMIHAAAAFIPCPDENLEDADCRWIMRAVRTQMLLHMSHTPDTRARVYADSVRKDEIPPNASEYSQWYSSNPPTVPATINHGRASQETQNIFEHLPLNGSSDSLANRPYIWEGLWDEWYAYHTHPRLEGERTMDGISYGPINQLLSLDENSLTGAAASVPGGCSMPCAMGDRPISWTRKMGHGLAAYNNAGHGDVYVRTRMVDGESVNDSLMEKYNWRLMKYLARDFVGCMNPGSPNYNPEATVETLTLIDHASPCQSVGIPFPAVSGSLRPEVAFRDGALHVTLPGTGPRRVRVNDAQGRAAHSATVQGGGEPVMVRGLRRGHYFVEVEGGRFKASERIRVE